MDWSHVIEFLKQINLQTLIVIGAMLWYFARHIEDKIEKRLSLIDKRIFEQGKRTDRLYEMFIDLLKEKK